MKLEALLNNVARISVDGPLDREITSIAYDSRRAKQERGEEGILARSHVSLGNIHADRLDPDSAIAHYRAALTADPECVSAAVNLGMTHASQKRLNEAQRWFEHAVRINPTSISAHHNLGITLRQLGREDEARQHFQEASRLLAGK